MAEHLTPEEMMLLAQRNAALEASVSQVRRGRGSDWYEMMWERTLGEVSGGRFDSFMGLRVFVAELQAQNEREAFIDAAAVKVIQGLTDPEERERFAREAYDMAEALWEERKRRRNGGSR